MTVSNLQQLVLSWVLLSCLSNAISFNLTKLQNKPNLIYFSSLELKNLELPCLISQLGLRGCKAVSFAGSPTMMCKQYLLFGDILGLQKWRQQYQHAMVRLPVKLSASHPL